jgi:hypothetical protein
MASTTRRRAAAAAGTDKLVAELAAIASLRAAPGQRRLGGRARADPSVLSKPRRRTVVATRGDFEMALTRAVMLWTCQGYRDRGRCRRWNAFGQGYGAFPYPSP